MTEHKTVQCGRDRPTPRTDAKEKETAGATKTREGIEKHAYYAWKFARNLEREHKKLEDSRDSWRLIAEERGVQIHELEREYNRLSEIGRAYIEDLERDNEVLREQNLAMNKTIIAESKWISVKDRLPELVFRDNTPVPGGAPATLRSARVLVFDGIVRIDQLVQVEGQPDTRIFYSANRDAVTLWKPLPNPSTAAPLPPEKE